MISALALAAALQAGDVYTDAAGCQWKRRPPAAAKSASGAKKAVKPAGKPRPAKAKPKEPDDEFIGCDEEGFGVWKSDLEADLAEIMTEPFVPIETVMPLEPDAPAAVTFTEACDCDQQAVPYPAGGYAFSGGGGGGSGSSKPDIPDQHTIPPAIPEPSTWLLLLGGAVALRMTASLRRQP